MKNSKISIPSDVVRRVLNYQKKMPVQRALGTHESALTRFDSDCTPESKYFQPVTGSQAPQTAIHL